MGNSWGAPQPGGCQHAAPPEQYGPRCVNVSPTNSLRDAVKHNICRALEGGSGHGLLQELSHAAIDAYPIIYGVVFCDLFFCRTEISFVLHQCPLVEIA